MSFIVKANHIHWKDSIIFNQNDFRFKRKFNPSSINEGSYIFNKNTNTIELSWDNWSNKILKPKEAFSHIFVSGNNDFQINFGNNLHKLKQSEPT